MVYTVVGKSEVARVLGAKGTRYSIELAHDIDGDDAWKSKVFVSDKMYHELAIGDCFEMNPFRVSGVPAVASKEIDGENFA